MHGLSGEKACIGGPYPKIKTYSCHIATLQNVHLGSLSLKQDRRARGIVPHSPKALRFRVVSVRSDMQIESINRGTEGKRLMNRLSNQSRTSCFSFHAILSPVHRAESCREFRNTLRKLSIRSARLFFVAVCLGNTAARNADAGCGCSDRGEASCTTCETCAETPRLCGLGNGLLDYLDRASGRFESSLFRPRLTGCSCDSKGGSACDSFDGGAGSSILNDEGQQYSIIQHHTPPSHAHPESWQPSQSNSSGNSWGGNSSGTIYHSPVPIPDPMSSPPMSSPVPEPIPRAGNPFTDEARSLRKYDDLETPPKIVYSLRSSSTPTFGSIQGDFAKVDVKPVPKHLLRGRSVEKALDSQEIDRQIQAMPSEVIPAASVSPTSSSKIQFAR